MRGGVRWCAGKRCAGVQRGAFRARVRRVGDAARVGRACARRAMRLASWAVAAVLLAALACGGVFQLAFAEEGVDPENQLNEKQLPDSSFIYDTSISDLDTADSYLDGQTVQITGEVVGDRIHAELDADHCWITLEATDGSYAEMAVFATMAATSVIDTYGAYGKHGTTLQVRGTFNLSCSEHEGVTDLHADHVAMVSKGYVQGDQFDAWSFAPGGVLTVVGLALIVVFYRMRESRR